MRIELLVRLVIPDNTAKTALQALHRLGFKIEDLKREDWYSFEIDDDAGEFMERIQKVDVLVNANKNRSVAWKAGEDEGESGYVKLLVKSRENNTGGLLATLRNRLGFDEIKSMEKGTLWKLKPADKKVAEKAAEELLANPHYEEYEIF